MVACREAHQVVVAPPGTGKTYLSIRAAAAVGEELPDHARVLLLTFSRQARSQLEREAARQLSTEQRRRIEITNYHRLCWQAVNAYRRCLGLPQELDVGSSRRRQAALRAASPEGWAVIKEHSGLCDSLAEHAFAIFRDHRTPSPDLLEPLLTCVHEEQAAGRLVFDDFGALFWQLLETQPTVAAAFGARYPAVLADEHQDASALQDAIVRRLGTRRLIVLADYLQLIHGFRGADIERLRQHWRDSTRQHQLHTTHRWIGRDAEGRWLLALRDRVEDGHATAPCPAGLRLRRYPGDRGMNGALAELRYDLLRLWEAEHSSIAVLVRNNTDLPRVRNYLISRGMRPRQLGGPRDFEEAREDIEQLPLLTDPHSVVLHAVDRLVALVPSIPKRVIAQLNRRLQPTGPNRPGAKLECAALLVAFDDLYEHGAAAYFHAMSELLQICRELGYHLPRADATRAIIQTARALAPGADLSEAVTAYGQRVLETQHHAPQRTDRGLFLMTAHQAKGKEFDAVVVIPLDARRWPDDEEHRKLFYVAMTRATRSWTLIVPDQGASPLARLLP